MVGFNLLREMIVLPRP